MLLPEWVEREGHGAIQRLADESGVTRKTIYRAAKKGHVIRDHPTAKRLADASLAASRLGLAITIEEITEPERFVKKKRPGKAA